MMGGDSGVVVREAVVKELDVGAVSWDLDYVADDA